MSTLLTMIEWPVGILKSQRTLCISFSITNSGLSTYHLLVCSNFNLLHNSQWIIFPTQSSIVLFSVCACSPHSLINRFISFFTKPTLEIFLRIINFRFVTISPYSIILYWDSVPLLIFLPFCHVQVISCAIYSICYLKYPYSCFSPDFCLLFVVLLFLLRLTLLLLPAVINISLHFFLLSLSPRIVVFTQSLMLAIPFLTHIVSVIS